MTEHQIKELSKYFLDNGNRKLSKEEKETIKVAIDQADNLNELLQVAYTSTAKIKSWIVWRRIFFRECYFTNAGVAVATSRLGE